MIKLIISKDRRLRIQQKKISDQLIENEHLVANIADQYLSSYAKYYSLGVEFCVDSINKFTQQYLEDIREFESTGKFPFQVDGYQFDLSRTEYDVVLISSVVLSAHRLRIMQKLLELAPDCNSAAVIGVGSGLEVAYIEQKHNIIQLYDLKINSFLSHRFPHYPAHERAFGVSENATFDAIYAIELLEHLIDPCELIKGISNKLRKGGVFICTTIKNVPQYDHLYNFTNADVFEREVKDYGFHLERRIVLPHHSAFTQLEMNNIFYIFRKS